MAAAYDRGVRHTATMQPIEIEILDDEGMVPAGTTGSHVAGHDPELTILDPESLPFPVADTLRRVADETGARFDRAFFRWNHRWDRLARVGDIRSQSRLKLHAWAPLPDLLDAIGGHPIEVHDRGRRVLWSEAPLTPWRRGAHRTAATLSIRWSWPNLPVWIVAEPWWREHSVLTISLRTTRRLRYPRRYWEASHRALRALVVDNS